MSGYLSHAFDLIARLWRHPDERPDGSNLRMKRWDGEKWVYRPMTDEERNSAEWWYAIR